MNNTIQLKRYDYEKEETVLDGTTDARTIARNIDADQLAEIVIAYVNINSNAFAQGQQAGERIVGSHRTIQGLVYNLCLGILVKIGEQGWPDDRNETAVAGSKKIASMIDKSEIKLQRFI